MKNMGTILFSVAIGICLLITIGCLPFLGRRLALKSSFARFKAEIISVNPTVVRVSGFGMNSAMGIDTVSTRKIGKSIVVIVHYSTRGRQGNSILSYDCKIDDDIDQICFGDINTIIWERNKLS